MSSDIPENDDKKPWTVHDHFVFSATLLGGGVVRWKAAVAEKLRISRSYMLHLVSGARPLTENAVYNLVEAMRCEAIALRERAAWLETAEDDLLKAYDKEAGKQPYVYVEPVPEPEPTPEPEPESEPPVTQFSRYATNEIQHEFVAGVLDGLLDDEDK